MTLCCKCKHVIWDGPGSGKFWNPANPYIGVHPETLARALCCKMHPMLPTMSGWDYDARMYPPKRDNWGVWLGHSVVHKYCHFINQDGNCPDFEAV